MPEKAVILVVDDEPTNLNVISKLFETQYNVKVAINGKKALVVLEKFTIDLVLLDIQMPEMDGFEVLRRIREKYTHLPVIFLTSQSNEASIVKGFEYGGNDYISKPFNVKELRARVKTHLQIHQLQTDLKCAKDELKRYTVSLEERIKERTGEIEKLANEYRFLLDNLPLMVFYKDTKNTIITVNKAAADSLGLSVDAMRNQPASKFYPFCAEDHYAHDLHVINTGQPQENSKELLASTKAKTWVSASRYPIFNASDSVIGVLVVCSDISEQKALETANNQQEALLVQQSKMAMAGEMIAAIAHQLKQPLNVIALATCMLNECVGNPDKLFEIGTKVEDQINFMAITIDDFKNFFLPSQQEKVFRPCESIKKIKNLFQGSFDQQNIQIIVHEHTHFHIQGHPSQFMQVILNLFANAKDEFENLTLPNKRIECRFEIEDDYGLIMIQDNAGGIPQELLPKKLFERYVSTKAEKGTGIGLQISKMIIEEKMQGTLQAENAADGALFTIKLPLSSSV